MNYNLKELISTGISVSVCKCKKTLFIRQWSVFARINAKNHQQQLLCIITSPVVPWGLALGLRILEDNS